MIINGTLLAAASTLCATGTAELIRKKHPSSADWPSTGEWNALNRTFSGALIRSTPVASCYKDSDFLSVVNCKDVTENWFLSEIHAVQPESIGYSYWANNSCVPPPTIMAIDQDKPAKLAAYLNTFSRPYLQL
jgi:hypothetical protein